MGRSGAAQRRPWSAALATAPAFERWLSFVRILAICRCTVCLLTIPGAGDDIQAIKAGIIEIADILVVNKADRPGADEAVKDLRQIFGGRKKVLTVADEEDKADVTVEVLERTTSVPKVSIGVGPSGSMGAPGMTMPSRAVRLRVRVTRGETTVEFTNKSTPLGNANGWKAAADDVAKQIEKWLLKAR